MIKTDGKPTIAWIPAEDGRPAQLVFTPARPSGKNLIPPAPVVPPVEESGWEWKAS